MFWLLITAIAYFLNAVAAIVDKFLIAKRIKNPAVYAFFISVLGVLVIILVPFGFEIPSVFQIILSFLAGGTFVFALLYLFKGLKVNDATRITPFIGGFSPLFIFFLSYLFLGERLSGKEILAFSVLIFGTVLITLNLEKKVQGHQGFGSAIFSAFLFALAYFLTKIVYFYQPFLSGFIWIRIGAFFSAFLLLIPLENRQAIFENLHLRKKPFWQRLLPGKKKKSTKFLFLFGQSCGAGSALLVNYAIYLASVILVNALQGLQYVFLLLIALALFKNYPWILEEKLKGKIIVQKISAILLITFGLFLLFFRT